MNDRADLEAPPTDGPPQRPASGSRLPLALSTLLTLAAYFLTSKFIAVRDGVDGIAVLGVVMAVSNVVALLADLNVSMEMSRRVAKSISIGDDDAAFATVAATRRITAAGSAILVVAIVAASPWLGPAIGTSTWVLLLAASSGGATAGAQLELSALGGVRRSRRVAMSSSVRSATILIVTVALVLAGLSVGVAYSSGMWMGWLSTRLFSAGIIRRPSTRPSRRLYGELLRVGRVTVSSLAAYTGVAMALPVILIAVADREVTGLYRAATLLSGGLGMLFNSLIRYEYLPRISQVTEPDQAAGAVRSEFRLLVGAMTFFALAIVPVASLAMRIAFADEFQGARGLLSFTLAGDVLRCGTIVLGISVYALRGARRWFVIEAVNGLAFLSLMTVAANADANTTRWLGVAYVVAQLVGVLAAASVLTRHVLRRPPIVEVVCAATAAGWVLASAAATATSPILGGLLACVGILLAASIVVVTRRRAT